jgi:uncharacterized protein
VISFLKGEGKMPQQHVETVKRLFAAVRRRDQAGVREAYHPEVVIHESPSLPYGGDYHGHEEALQHLNGYYRTWDPLRPGVGQPSTPIFLETAEDSVVVLWQEEAVAPGSGRRIVLPALGVYQVRDGKVAESRMFQDTAAIRDLLAEAQRQTG